MEIARQGLTASKWWAKYVRDKDSCRKYFELYKPEYPDQLATAITLRIEKLLQKSRTGEPLTEEELKYI